MPPGNSGEASWSPDQVELFRNWITDGYQAWPRCQAGTPRHDPGLRPGRPRGWRQGRPELLILASGSVGDRGAPVRVISVPGQQPGGYRVGRSGVMVWLLAGPQI